VLPMFVDEIAYVPNARCETPGTTLSGGQSDWGGRPQYEETEMDALYCPSYPTRSNCVRTGQVLEAVEKPLKISHSLPLQLREPGRITDR